MAEQLESQGRRAWPDCDRCGLPIIPKGLGTALKPACEPIVVARKPLIGTVAANVTAYGTGALNIDGCRIGEPFVSTGGPAGFTTEKGWNPNSMGAHEAKSVSGRWPANVVLDEAAGALLDAMSGERKSSPLNTPVGYEAGNGTTLNRYLLTEANNGGYSDTGGASRFFYCAKASRAEREIGMAGMPLQDRRSYEGGPIVSADHPDTSPGGHTQPAANNHPTVKPIALMQWLVRLVTPPGGLVCDPFAGSGSTGIAAHREGFRFVGIELSPEYAEIARKRMAADAAVPRQLQMT